MNSGCPGLPEELFRERNPTDKVSVLQQQILTLTEEVKSQKVRQRVLLRAGPWGWSQGLPYTLMLGWEALSRHSLGTSWMSWCYPFVCACFCPAQGRMTVLQPLLGSNSQQMDWKREVKQIQVYSAGILLIHLYCSVNVQSWIGTVTLAETAGLSHIVNNKLIFMNSDPPQGSDLTVEVSAWVTAKTVSPVFYCFLQA